MSLDPPCISRAQNPIQSPLLHPWTPLQNSPNYFPGVPPSLPWHCSWIHIPSFPACTSRWLDHPGLFKRFFLILHTLLLWHEHSSQTLFQKLQGGREVRKGGREWGKDGCKQTRLKFGSQYPNQVIDLQSPLIPTPRDPNPFFGFHGHLHSYACIHAYT